MKLAVLIASFLLSLTSFGQLRSFEPHSRNVVFVEAGGIGGYGSLNYERALVQRNRFDFNFRAGVSTYHIKDFTNKLNPDLIFPLSISAMYGHNHHLEIGAGKVLTSFTYFNEETGGPGRQLRTNNNVFVGYRYERDEGGLMFRVTYSPLFTEDVRWTWGGVSIGYAF